MIPNGRKIGGFTSHLDAPGYSLTLRTFEIIICILLWVVEAFNAHNELALEPIRNKRKNIRGIDQMGDGCKCRTSARTNTKTRRHSNEGIEVRAEVLKLQVEDRL